MSDPLDERFGPDFIESAREGLQPTAADRARLRRSIAAQIVGLATVTATTVGAAAGTATGGTAVAATAAGASVVAKVVVGALALSVALGAGAVVVHERGRQPNVSVDAGALVTLAPLVPTSSSRFATVAPAVPVTPAPVVETTDPPSGPLS